ncbi:diaminopimelate decarboxylase [Streptomyces albus]|uniref:diaminopimelate decarboxylase n=1 Tax=Streptomyces albus TaxID=1888 RepID=UPI000B326F25|nr:diaminopimelate decarboxylase [Streptomyces albus]
MTALTHSWLNNIDLAHIAEEAGTPVFVYSEAQFRKNLDRIRTAAVESGLDSRVELYIPFFPNSNPHVLEPLKDMPGTGLLVQLPSEYRILRRFGFDRFIVSPGHVSDQEIDFWDTTGHPVFLASLDEVAHALRTNAPTISVRIDSLDSGKPGIKYAELDELVRLLKQYGRDLEGLEVYCGSGNSLEDMVGIVEQVFDIYLRHFPTAQSVNFAGGHGFDYDAWEESEKHFDWQEYFIRIRQSAERMDIPEHVKFLFEPARDVLADTGALLLSVERDVISTPVSNILVTNGCRMLMPSAQLRDRNHNVAFLDASMKEITSTVTTSAALRGRTILRNDYILPGDVLVPEGVGADGHLAILDVGAYCATQHMEFLNVPPAAEVLVAADGSPHLITSPGGEHDKWRNLLAEKRELPARPLREPAAATHGA